MRRSLSLHFSRPTTLTPVAVRSAFAFFLVLSPVLFFAGCSGDSGSGPSGETPSSFSASIAPWPGTAIAAYTLIADDYYLPSQAPADTIMANRGMGMGFGAIVSGISGSTWQDAREKIARGHEILNHSWNHPCFTEVEECGSEPVVGPEAFGLQLKQSTETIERETGVRPTFMVFPYDCATDTALSYLKNELGYLGARMGQKQKLNTNAFDPFRPNFDVNWPEGEKEGAQMWTLNEMVDAVLAQGYGWAIREIHGVDGGWGPVPFAEMRDHADYLKSKVDSGLLWVAPPSRVVQYHNQRKSYALQTSVRIDSTTVNGVLETEEVFVIDFVGSAGMEHYTEPLTLVVTGLPDRGYWVAVRSNEGSFDSMVRYSADGVRISVVPTEGSVELRLTNGAG